MTKPIKLTKDRQGKSFYPATTTDAVVDQKRVKALSEILDDIDEAIANSGSSGGEGDALTENSVNTTHIVDGAVTTSKIARSAVTKERIADNAVTTSKIADGNVTEEKLSEGLQSTIAALQNGTGLQEGVITMGKLEQSVQDAINDKGSSVTIVNNLTEGGADKALSAEMGKTLSERIEEVAEQGGAEGKEGKSAYEVWLEQGNSGTEQDFINSLKGEKGDKGEQGERGLQGNSGYTGAEGELEVVNNLSDGGATKALSAEMGKDLGDSLNAIADITKSYRDIELNWVYGKYMADDGEVKDSGDWAYAIIPITAGDYTLWKNKDEKWKDSTYHHIYLYSSEAPSRATFVKLVYSPQFTIDDTVKAIAITESKDRYNLPTVRLSYGLDAPYDNVLAQVKDSSLSSNIVRKNDIYSKDELNNDFLSRNKLDMLFGQAEYAETYPFLTNITRVRASEFEIVPNRYINGKVVVGGGNGWKLYKWWKVDELTDYTIYEAEGRPFIDSTYHYIGCFSDKDENSYLGIATNKGNGTHTTVKGTKYIAFTRGEYSQLLPEEGIKVFVGADMPYNSKSKYVLNPSVENGIGINASSILGELTPYQTGRIRTFDIASSKTVVFFGNSYTAGGFSLKKKQYTYLLSMLTGHIIVNRGVGAQDLYGNMRDYAADYALNDWPAPSKLNIEYAFITEAKNDSQTDDEYRAILVDFIHLLRSRGIKVILSTEHYGTKDSTSNVGRRYLVMRDVANQLGIPFIKWGDFADATKVLGFEGFKFEPAGHVATRTYWSWANGLLPFMKTLGETDSIKLFRQRAGTDFASLPTFMDVYERATYFDELLIGGAGNTKETEKYVDRQQSGVAEDIVNEYGNLMKGKEVVVGDYLLVGISTENAAISMGVEIDADNIQTVYYRQYDGEWVSIDYANKLTLDNYLPKISSTIYLLLVGASITLRNVSVSYLGDKKKTNSFTVPNIERGESIIDSTMDSEKWNGTYSEYTPVVSSSGQSEPLPLGITKVVELTSSSDNVQQSYTIADPDVYNGNKCQIRIMARYFPKYIGTDADWETTEITTDTFDMAPITISIGGNKITRYVGLWWDNIVIDTWVSTKGSIKIESPSGKVVHISKVEVVRTY